MVSMWFGTRGYESWVKMPMPDIQKPYTGRYTRNDQSNGGVSVDASASGHEEYALAWNGRIDELQDIVDYFTGQYSNDANAGLIYFVDPSTSGRNHFPALWASPFLCGIDAPSLTKGVRPALSSTAGNSFKLPARTATFTTTISSAMLKLYVPIPPGFEARWAFYGPTAQTAKIHVDTYVSGGITGGADYDVVANASYGTGLTTSSGVDGIEFSLKQVDGSVVLTAAVLYIVRTGTPAITPTKFTGGRGHSGCVLDSPMAPIINAVHDDINWANLTAHLVEVGSWR